MPTPTVTIFWKAVRGLSEIWVVLACLFNGLLPLRGCVPQPQLAPRACDQTNQGIGFSLESVVNRELDLACFNIN